MSSLQDLNDPNKTCIYLAPRNEYPADFEHSTVPPQTFESSHDDYERRLEGYRVAWTRCLNRIQSIVHTLHAPLVSAVTRSIRAAHETSSKVPGLAFPELPVLAVSAAGGSNTIVNDIVRALERGPCHANANATKEEETATFEDGELQDSSRPVILTHVYPVDCTNLASAMKTIVSGFVDRDVRDNEDGNVALPAPMKRKATMSLANYDVNLLCAWHDALNALHDEPPILVALLHDFEKFDPNVMQDMFYIFNQYVESIPLIFVLSMSTPSPSTYLHSVFARTTLALLRLQVHTAPSDITIVEEIMERTFFDVNFKPSVTLGPGTLEFISDFCSRHSAMLDVALTILQIAHLKHFEEPLTVLVHDHEPKREAHDYEHPLHRPENAALLDDLLSHLHDLTLSEDTSVEATFGSIGSPRTEWQRASVEGLIRMVDKAREAFHHKATRMRLGFQVFTCVRRTLQAQGIKFSMPGARDESPLELMCRVVRGRMTRNINHITMIVKKLSDPQLQRVLADLYKLFYDLPAHLRREEIATREFIVQVRSRLSEDQDDDLDASPASMMAEWMKSYLSERLVRLDEGPLWFIWNTGSTPFPSELINPAPRMTVINALLHPHEFVEEFEALFSGKEKGTDPDHRQREEDLTDLPDTSILFRRYMEAGKTINVYDWYGAFAQVLDAQRRKLAKQQSKPIRGRKGKGKARKKDDVPDLLRDVAIEKMSEAEQEAWQREVQARFIRALHELDFMGFIKHTGRKADHIIRSVYDIPD